jgi:hypothetical protein
MDALKKYRCEGFAMPISSMIDAFNNDNRLNKAVVQVLQDFPDSAVPGDLLLGILTDKTMCKGSGYDTCSAGRRCSRGSATMWKSDTDKRVKGKCPVFYLPFVANYTSGKEKDVIPHRSSVKPHVLALCHPDCYRAYNKTNVIDRATPLREWVHSDLAAAPAGAAGAAAGGGVGGAGAAAAGAAAAGAAGGGVGGAGAAGGVGAAAAAGFAAVAAQASTPIKLMTSLNNRVEAALGHYNAQYNPLAINQAIKPMSKRDRNSRGLPDDFTEILEELQQQLRAEGRPPIKLPTNLQAALDLRAQGLL